MQAPQLLFASDILHYITTPPSSCTAPVPSAYGQSSKKALELSPDPCLRYDHYSTCPSSARIHMPATQGQTSCPATWTSPILPPTSERETNLKVKRRLWSWTTSEPIWRHTLDMGIERVGSKSKAWMIAIARSISWSRLELWWQESRLKMHTIVLEYLTRRLLIAIESVSLVLVFGNATTALYFRYPLLRC